VRVVDCESFWRIEMRDLKERFREADGLPTPDLWDEVRARGAAPGREGLARSTRPGLDGRKPITVAVAFMVFAAAGTFAWVAFRGTETDRSIHPVPVEDPFGDVEPGWSELPVPPEVRSYAATAWTGSQLLVWGGDEFAGSGGGVNDDGFIFDATDGAWRPLPDAPLNARSFPAAAWTGSELLVWGGSAPGSFGQYVRYDDGAAYDPATRRWRALPPAPIDGRAPVSVWTGEELIVWGSQDRELRRVDGAAYDPSEDRWRRIADAPIELTDATAVWTGEEMIVFGAALHGGNFPETPTAIGGAYDPERDTWRQLPPSDLSPQAHTAAWVGGEMIALDYEQGTAAYDPSTNGWRPLADIPLRFYECSPRSVAIDGFVFANFCGATAVYSAAVDRWHDTARPDLSGWVLEPVAAGQTFLVMGRSQESGERKMLAFNPLDGLQCAGTQHVDPTQPEGATYVVERFQRMRFDDARADIGGILSLRGEAAFADPDSGLQPLVGGYYHFVWEVLFVDGPLGPDDAYEVGVRMRIGLGERVVEETYFVSPGRNLEGEHCPLVIDGGRPGVAGP
jgi:N-acetylneuraminic acid mutarotase